MGKELKRLKGRIEEKEEEYDFMKKLNKNLRITKERKEELDRHSGRKEFIQNLREILKEATGE